MEQIKQLETHTLWKHVATGGLYALMGYGVWKGGVNDRAVDNASVIAAKQHGDGIANFDVVPAHYTVGDVRSADVAILQTTKELQYGDQVVVYQGDGKAFVRRYEDFFDGRFVKVDETGQEIVVVKKASAVGKSESSAS